MSEPATVEQEVLDLCRNLIRIDTSNRGGVDGARERPAAEYVAARLAEVGLAPELLESAPGRASVVARVAGRDRSRPALLVHGHLDVVPADPADWQVDPFAGEVRDGCLWGRGAVDMKDFDAVALAVVRDRLRTGRPPARDLVLAFVADEEAGGGYGARWLVDEHPDLFDGCTEAIGEVGGFSVTISADRRLYFVETAQKGMAWLRLVASGRAGHGSMVHPDNAVTALAETVARLGRHEFPLRMTATVQALLEQLAAALGVPYDPADPEALVARLGPVGRLVGATLRNTVAPTMLAAGYKVNVIPQVATAYVDGRFLPGYEDELLAEVDSLLSPGVRRETLHRDIALETSFDGPLVDAMAAALRAEDPGARPVPYCLSGGTDAKSFSRLGIQCFGFSRCGCPRTWTSPGCSTASTSGSPWTGWPSACGCSTGSSTLVDEE